MLAEDRVKTYQLRDGGIELGQQASALVSTLAKFQSDRDATKIEMAMTKSSLDELKQEFNRRNPTLESFQDIQTAEPAIKMLQDQIANLQTQKSIAIAGNANLNTN